MAPPYVFTSRDKKSRRDVQAGIILFAGSDASGTPVGIRTPNLLIRSQTLYPAELRAHIKLYNNTTTNLQKLQVPATGIEPVREVSPAGF